jgi:excisionase family DNA binding protein
MSVRIADAPDLMTVKECASLLRITLHKAYELVKAEEIPAIRLGGRWRIPKARLIADLGLASTQGEPGAESESTPGSKIYALPQADEGDVDETDCSALTG